MTTFRDQAHAEAHYGQEIESATELHQLQRLEKRYGERLHGWLAEGMPKKAMGHPQEMADFRLQRSLEGTGTSREDVPGVVLDVIGSQGQSLDGTIQRTLEDRMDADFSSVRIHTRAKAADAADAINAKAFTCGSDIVFNSGEYDPESPEGQHLLAHELAHVKQQTGAAISMMPQEGAELEIDPNQQLEQEAEEMAAEVMSGEELGIQRFPDTEFHIQRATAGEDPYGESHEEFIEKQKERLYGSETEEENDADPVDPWRVLKDQVLGMGTAGAIGSFAKLVELGGFQPAIENPESFVIVAGVSMPAGAVIGGFKSLARQLTLEEIRRVFIDAGKSNLLETVLPMLFGEGEEETGQETEAGQSRRS